MTTQTAEYARSVITAEDFEPFVVGGEAIGEVHWIRTEGAEGATLAEDALRAHVRQALAGYKTPKRIFATTEVLRASNGKCQNGLSASPESKYSIRCGRLPCGGGGNGEELE